MIWSRLARAGARTALVAILGTATAAAWQARPPAQGGAQISGTVKNAADDRRWRAPASWRARESGQPIPTSPSAARTAGTSSPICPPGSYTISVTPHRLRAADLRLRAAAGAARRSTVAAGQSVSGIDFALVPGRAITGRILDEDGTPFAGAVVRALVSRFGERQRHASSRPPRETDDRGEFRLFGLAPGQYYVSRRRIPRSNASARAHGTRRYSPTYYPGVPFADQAKPIALAASGQEPRVEFKLQLVPPARVSRDPRGRGRQAAV